MTSTDFLLDESAVASPLVAPRAGIPWDRQVQITDGKDRWATLGAFEARMQIRDGVSSTSALRYDMTPHLVKAFGTGGTANDIFISWSLSGAETRVLRAACGDKERFYDLLVSDPGVTDEEALYVLHGRIRVNSTVTAAS